MNSVLKRSLKHTLFLLLPSILFLIIMVVFYGVLNDLGSWLLLLAPVNLIFFASSYVALKMSERGVSGALILGIVNILMLGAPLAVYVGADRFFGLEFDGMLYAIFIAPICLVSFLCFAILSFMLVEKKRA